MKRMGWLFWWLGTGCTLFLKATSDMGSSELDLLSIVLPRKEAGVSVEPTGGLVTAETGGWAEFRVVLNTVPEGNVTLVLESTNLTEGFVEPSEMVFSPLNGLIEQRARVLGLPDGEVDGDQAYAIRVSSDKSEDEIYGKLGPTEVPVVNVDGTDLRVPGVSVSPPP